MYYLEAAVFFISSALIILSNLYKVPIKSLQQIIVLLLIVILVSISRFPSLKSTPGKAGGIQLFMLLLGSLFIQLLVTSTGGFYSPFLILIHLFVIGTGFLLDVKSSITFLLFTLVVLISNIILNDNMMKIFQSDPWSVVLYVVSFIAIIPLVQVVTRSYHLKQALSDMLSNYIKVEENRQESILKGLSELVVVTDQNLKVMSVNNAAERALNISINESINHNLFDVLSLKDSSGNPATPDTLSIKQALTDKATRIIDNLSLTVKTRPKPIRVAAQVRPIFDSANKISQIVFVIGESNSPSIRNVKHTNLEIAKQKMTFLRNGLEQELYQSKLATTLAKFALLNHINEDIVLAYELEDHPIKQTINFENLAYMVKQISDTKQNFAQALGIGLKYIVAQNNPVEQAVLKLQSTNAPEEIVPASEFSVPIDIYWLSLCLGKLVEIAVLLSANTPIHRVVLSIEKSGNKSFNIKILTSYPKSNTDLKGLFTQDYSNFDPNSNLKFGSGLEGLIAKKIADEVGLQIETQYENYPTSLAFIVPISKQ